MAGISFGGTWSSSSWPFVGKDIGWHLGPHRRIIGVLACYKAPTKCTSYPVLASFRLILLPRSFLLRSSSAVPVKRISSGIRVSDDCGNEIAGRPLPGTSVYQRVGRHPDSFRVLRPFVPKTFERSSFLSYSLSFFFSIASDILVFGCHIQPNYFRAKIPAKFSIFIPRSRITALTFWKWFRYDAIRGGLHFYTHTVLQS